MTDHQTRQQLTLGGGEQTLDRDQAEQALAVQDGDVGRAFEALLAETPAHIARRVVRSSHRNPARDVLECCVEEGAGDLRWRWQSIWSHAVGCRARSWSLPGAKVRRPIGAGVLGVAASGIAAPGAVTG